MVSLLSKAQASTSQMRPDSHILRPLCKELLQIVLANDRRLAEYGKVINEIQLDPDERLRISQRVAQAMKSDTAPERSIRFLRATMPLVVMKEIGVENSTIEDQVLALLDEFGIVFGPFRLDPSAWKGDAALSKCEATTRGIWLDMLCLMFQAHSDDLAGPAESLARQCRCSVPELERALQDLKFHGIADTHQYPDQVTVRRLT